MFDVDEFVAECRRAAAESEPLPAVKELLERTMARPAAVAEALPAARAELTPLYASDELTVLKVIWAPGMYFRPHNHLMWAAIGLYGGQEDNAFYRRDGEGVIQSGGRELRRGDVALLGDDTIHSVSNPLPVHTGAIHIYGGDLTRRPDRSEWDEESGLEVPADFDRTRRYFESLNAQLDASTN
jgi:predicted metal-dependent enzyme (double-stranded beta helix superfamily)